MMHSTSRDYPPREPLSNARLKFGPKNSNNKKVGKLLALQRSKWQKQVRGLLPLLPVTSRPHETDSRSDMPLRRGTWQWVLAISLMKLWWICLFKLINTENCNGFSSRSDWLNQLPPKWSRPGYRSTLSPVHFHFHLLTFLSPLLKFTFLKGHFA